MIFQPVHGFIKESAKATFIKIVSLSLLWLTHQKALLKFHLLPCDNKLNQNKIQKYLSLPLLLSDGEVDGLAGWTRAVSLQEMKAFTFLPLPSHLCP